MDPEETCFPNSILSPNTFSDQIKSPGTFSAWLNCVLVVVMTKTLVLVLNLPSFSSFSNWSNQARGKAAHVTGTILPMVTGPWEVSEVEDLLLMRGCWWRCHVSRERGWGWVFSRPVSELDTWQGVWEWGTVSFFFFFAHIFSLWD